MPISSPEGKEWIKKLVGKLSAKCKFSSILDVGAGAGTYSNLLRSILSESEFIGLEVWEPYISRYDLTKKYDRIIKQDVREYIPDKPFAFTFLGDVLEHMEKEEAVEVYEKLLKESEFVIISIPIIHYPQGNIEGNPYERHIKEDWTHQEVLSTFSNLVLSQTGNVVGVYLGVNPKYHSAKKVVSIINQ